MENKEFKDAVKELPDNLDMSLLGKIILAIFIIVIASGILFISYKGAMSLKPKDYIYTCDVRFGELEAESYSINELTMTFIDVTIEGQHYDAITMNNEGTWVCVANLKDD